MTLKVLNTLEQIQAIKEALEERSETLTNRQAAQLDDYIACMWRVVDRRKVHRNI